MISDRERRVLERIEAHLRETDPDLVRMFREGLPRAVDPGMPRVLLVFGLTMVVLGAVAALVPVTLFGMMLTLVALWTASIGPGRSTRFA